MVADLDGVCNEGPKSTNKGWTCISNEDCPSSLAGLFASCRCGFNS
jgi:hypothetical protein